MVIEVSYSLLERSSRSCSLARYSAHVLSRKIRSQRSHPWGLNTYSISLGNGGSGMRSSIIELVIRFEFHPPDEPWSTNQDRNLSPHERSDRILNWKTITKVTYVSFCNRNGQGRLLGPSLVRIHIPFRTKRRRDPHNYCGTVVKAIIDGLVQGGAWPDDTPQYVEHLSPVLHRNTMVEVVIYPRDIMRLPCEHGFYERHDSCDGYEEVEL